MQNIYKKIWPLWNAMKVDIFTTRLFFDPLAIPLTILCSKISWITPNKVTLLALFPGLAGSFYFFYGNYGLGALGYYLFFLLDSIDGKLARLTSIFDPLGAFYDFVVDRVVISLMVFGMCFSFFQLEMISEFLLSFCFILLFLLKDVFDLKWNESGVAEDHKPVAAVGLSGVLVRFKIHFKPGQLLSCFIVFIVGPLSSHFKLCFMLGILCILFSILSNVIVPYAIFMRSEKS